MIELKSSRTERLASYRVIVLVVSAIFTLPYAVPSSDDGHEHLGCVFDATGLGETLLGTQSGVVGDRSGACSGNLRSDSLGRRDRLSGGLLGVPPSCLVHDDHGTRIEGVTDLLGGVASGLRVFDDTQSVG